MDDQNCAYCAKGELLAEFAYPVCAMESGYLYLCKEQSKKGRIIVAFKDHVGELVDLSDEDRNAFFADVAKAARVVHKLYHPDKVNYGSYADTGHHLHMHIVPKYEGGHEWGRGFTVNPEKIFLSDEEYEAMAVLFRAEL